MTRRLIRIVPVYWLASTLYLLMALAIPAFEKSYSTASVVASYLFIPWPRLDGIMQPLVGQGWTLNYEMFFYAIFAIAVLAPRRIAVAAASTVLIVAVGAGRLYPPSSPTLAFWVDPIVLEFVFGMIVGLAYREGLRLPKPVALLTVVAGFALMYLAYGYFESRLLSLGLPAAVIVAGAAFGDFSLRSPVWRPVAALGDASYALYLFHSIPIRAILIGGSWLSLDIAGRPWPYLAAAVVGAIGLAFAIYYLFERPVTQLLRRRKAPADGSRSIEKLEGFQVPASDIKTLGVK